MSEWINRYEYGPARRVTLSPGVERLVRAAAEPPRCRTCRYWLPFGPRNLTGECESWDVADYVSGVDAEFLPAADFGCVEHSPHPEPTEETHER